MKEVIYIGSSSMGYNGKVYKSGEKLTVSDSFFALHRSRLLQVEDEVIEAEYVEIENVKPKKKAKK